MISLTFWFCGNCHTIIIKGRCLLVFPKIDFGSKNYCRIFHYWVCFHWPFVKDNQKWVFFVLFFVSL